LLKDEKEVGTVDLEVDGDIATLKAMDITEDVDVIHENVLRQIATFVRKHFKDVIRIEVEVPENLRDVYLNNNFVPMDAEHPHHLTKLIRY